MPSFLTDERSKLMKAKKSSLENRPGDGVAGGTGAEAFKFTAKGDWTVALTFADGSHPYEAKITIERDECVMFIR